MRPVVDRDPGAGGHLHGFDLPADAAVGGPALGHQRRSGVAAGEPHRGHIQVQPRQVRRAARRGGQGELAADLFGHRGQRVQRPAEPVIVEQSRGHAEQFGHRRRRRPARDVIQRRRRAQPVGHQRGDHLPVGQHRPPAHRHRRVDELHQAQPAQVMVHQQQRPDVAAGTGRRRIQPGERGRQLLELARRLELVLAAQRAQHPVPHPALLIPVGFDQPQIHVALAALDDGVALNVHAGPIPLPSVGPTLSRSTPHYKHVIQCVCTVVRSRDLALHGQATHRSVGGTNHGHQNRILNSRNGLPHTTTHRSSPGNQALRSISAENGASAHRAEHRPVRAHARDRLDDRRDLRSAQRLRAGDEPISQLNTGQHPAADRLLKRGDAARDRRVVEAQLLRRGGVAAGPANGEQDQQVMGARSPAGR